MPDLCSPLTIKGVTLRNRIAMSPMTQHRALDGRIGDFHVMLTGSRAAGGFGLVFPEQVAITPDQGFAIRDDPARHDIELAHAPALERLELHGHAALVQAHDVGGTELEDELVAEDGPRQVPAHEGGGAAEQGAALDARIGADRLVEQLDQFRDGGGPAHPERVADRGRATPGTPWPRD